MSTTKTVRFIDLFCGIGGFHYAIKKAARQHGHEVKCVLSSDIDPDCQVAYEANFKEKPVGDIRTVKEAEVPDHDFLLGGFPCQTFSIIGHRKGFEDARGTLFFEIARILKEKQPKTFVLENVKQLVGHNGGKTLARIMEVLKELEYHADFKVLNALNFGLPQKRERVFIVGFKNDKVFKAFEWPSKKIPMKPLDKILEKNVPSEYYASDYIKAKRLEHGQPKDHATIWHENKAGHISILPYSCALRAGASYNYLLVNGERRMTAREMLRLQGIPDTFKIVCNYTQARKQAGNSLPVPVATAVLNQAFEALRIEGKGTKDHGNKTKTKNR